MKNELLKIVNAHALKASNSQYDQGVCVLAISTARQTIMSISTDLPTADYQEQVLQSLTDLFTTYHDGDGEYTSGKGVIGSLLADISAAFRA